MSFWKTHHWFAVITITGVAALFGLVTGVALADPPLNITSQTSLVSLLVEKEVERQLGAQPARVTPLSYEEPLTDLRGNVLEASDQPQENYFIVHMKEDTQLQSSLIEGVPEDILDLSDSGIYVAEVLDDQVTLLNVRY